MIRLGNKVKDKSSGFTGIAFARVEYFNGCIQYSIRPLQSKKQIEDGVYPDSFTIDEEYLQYIGPGMNKEKRKTIRSAGGPVRSFSTRH